MTFKTTSPQTLTIVGDGLLLHQYTDRTVQLVVLHAGRPRTLGSAASVADAWRAIDGLDMAGLTNASDVDMLAAWTRVAGL